jgi:division protein CdvB (Snf7/Vps24/ESCRT-III family)
LERTEVQTVSDIKKRAKTPGVNPSTDIALKTLAKQLVQIRQQKEKLLSTKCQMGALSMKTTVMSTQIGAAQAMGSVTGAMAKMNAAVDVKDMHKIMNQFGIETERMNMKEEIMDDILSDAFDSEGVEEEAEHITNQVLAELGIELDSQMVGLTAPHKLPPLKQGQQQISEEDQALADLLPDLKARLDKL